MCVIRADRNLHFMMKNVVPKMRIKLSVSYKSSPSLPFLYVLRWQRPPTIAARARCLPDQPKEIRVEQIIQKFAAKEKEFKEAREQYTWRQSVKVQTLDGNVADGEYQSVVDILFDDHGRRIEQVVYAPQSTLQRIEMTREDFEDIEKRMPFVFTSDEIPEYDIKYLGQQKEDELNTYVFDIHPKQIEKNQRYFEGRIWVDDHDFQIVKTYGKNVPDIVKKRQAGKPLPEVHDVARTDRRPLLVPDLHARGRRSALLERRHSHSADREVHQLQAIRIQGQNHLRRPGIALKAHG